MAAGDLPGREGRSSLSLSLCMYDISCCAPLFSRFLSRLKLFSRTGCIQSQPERPSPLASFASIIAVFVRLAGAIHVALRCRLHLCGDFGFKSLLL